MGWLKPRPERADTREQSLAPLITPERRTLAQRLEAGRLTRREALRIAMEVAHALRQIHDDGRAHGALSPFAIELTPSGIELVPGRTARGVPTPYTAPEVLKGQLADWRSDIFSFGAIVHEMITGRWPFEGDTPEMLAVALQNAATPQTGDPAVDSLLRHCLAKEPATRCQRIQKIQVELRLASVASRRTEGPDPRAQFEAVVRSEIQLALESQVEGRLQSQQAAVAQLHQALAISTERISRMERALETTGRRFDEHAASTATQRHALEQTVRAQVAALEAIRTALAQTDDLVERVVEALDFLQSTIMERSDFLQGAASAQAGGTVRPISG
jgi:eukaryotic-like serine/threonine-protein kinase